MSLDNSLMMEIYPFGGILAYLKYHFIDGITKQSTLLLDKTRVDYDSAEKKDKGTTLKPTIKNDEDMQKMMAAFGFGTELTEEERAEQIRKELDTE